MRRVILVVLAVVVTACGVDQPIGEPDWVADRSNGSLLDSDVATDPQRTSADVAIGAALEVRADGCGPRRGFGTASLVSEHLAVTAAHVVAGASSVGVIDQDGIEHSAQVVYFDPDLDIAVLRMAVQLGTPAPLSGRRVEPGDTALIAVFRGAAGERDASNLGVKIIRRANVATTDIYLEGEVLRPGFEIEGAIEPGDSGALVVLDGSGVGVLWARSTESAGRAWVVNIPQVLRGADLETNSLLSERVDTGDCVR